MSTKTEEYIAEVQRDKHQDFYQTHIKFLSVIAGDSSKSKVKVAGELREKLIHLMNVIPESHTPQWMVKIATTLQWYMNNINNSTAGGRMLKELMECVEGIKSKEWSIPIEDANLSFDFDELYRQYYEDSNLKELWDKLIDLLLKIIQSGYIKDDKDLDILKRAVLLAQYNNSPTLLAAFHRADVVKDLLPVIANYVALKLAGPAGEVYSFCMDLINAIHRDEGKVKNKYDQDLTKKLRGRTGNLISVDVEMADFVEQNNHLLLTDQSNDEKELAVE